MPAAEAAFRGFLPALRKRRGAQEASHWLVLFGQLFSVPARRRAIFSLCFQTTTAQTPRASGSHVHCPLTDSATGRAVTRVSDPRDTKPLRQITSRHNTEAASSCQKARGRNTPMLVATALPPLNFI